MLIEIDLLPLRMPLSFDNGGDLTAFDVIPTFILLGDSTSELVTVSFFYFIQ
jgi:hypothetical protein